MSVGFAALQPVSLRSAERRDKKPGWQEKIAPEGRDLLCEYWSFA
jgi:hypothetical protein